ncbi:MAG: DUF2849 domain-containing protein [Rhodobacteraceae bacterium]|nr:DUF2849 domain-containing protein [Paracoccaceae bacterium]
MPRKFTPKVITSNDLLEGDVIYLARDGEWVRDIRRAALYDDENEAISALACADSHRHRHVGAYLADAALNDEGLPDPVHFREVFRTRGPTNYFHGKQADS